MQIDLYTANIRQAELLRQAEQQRLVRSVQRPRQMALHFRLPFRLQWGERRAPAAPALRDCPTPC